MQLNLLVFAREELPLNALLTVQRTELGSEGMYDWMFVDFQRDDGTVIKSTDVLYDESFYQNSRRGTKLIIKDSQPEKRPIDPFGNYIMCQRLNVELLPSTTV